MDKKPKRKSLSLTLRNYFIAGVVVLIPIGFTLYLSKILIGISSKLIPKNLLKTYRQFLRLFTKIQYTSQWWTKIEWQFR